MERDLVFYILGPDDDRLRKNIIHALDVRPHLLFQQIVQLELDNPEITHQNKIL